VGKTHFDADV